MDEAQDVLVCVHLDAAHVELSEVDVCRECGAQVWVSPVGREIQAEKNLKVICIHCIPEDGVLAPPTGEQLLEILNYFRQGGGLDR